MLQSLVTFYEKKTWKLFLLRATKRVQKLNNSSQAAFRFKTKLKVSVVQHSSFHRLTLPLLLLLHTITYLGFFDQTPGVSLPLPLSLSHSIQVQVQKS